MPQSPYALSIVIADATYKDPVSGKKSILGCLSTIHANRFPFVYPQIVVAVTLTDGRGTMAITLRMEHANDESEILRSQDSMTEFNDPRTMHEIQFIMKDVVFEKPGEYGFQIWADDEFVIERRLVIRDSGSVDEGGSDEE